MWSDPEDILDWAVSPRGAGYLFGSKVTKEVSEGCSFSACSISHIYSHIYSWMSQFCRVNGLELICRAHQLVMEGFKYHFPEKNLVTVWSAPNYCYRCGNVASILALDEKLSRNFRLFHEVPDPDNSVEVQRRSLVPYFMWITSLCISIQHVFTKQHKKMILFMLIFSCFVSSATLATWMWKLQILLRSASWFIAVRFRILYTTT